MANYKYSVRDASGKVQNGTLSSESLEAAASILRGQGLRIVNIAPVVAGIDKDIEGEAILLLLNKEGIGASSGSAASRRVGRLPPRASRCSRR